MVLQQPLISASQLHQPLRSAQGKGGGEVRRSDSCTVPACWRWRGGGRGRPPSHEDSLQCQLRVLDASILQHQHTPGQEESTESPAVTFDRALQVAHSKLSVVIFIILVRELIAPTEVTVNSGHEVFLAQPVITPIEQLRRKDKEVARALEEKQKLIEEILNIPHEELESITEHNLAGAQPKTAAEILLSALSQAKSLTSLVNRSLKISEEEALEVMSGEAGGLAEQQKIVAKGERLIEITTTINKQLTMLLAIIQENERERESLRRELSRSQDQVRCLLSDAPWSSPLSPITPASISPMPSPLTSKSSSPPLSISDGLSR